MMKSYFIDIFVFIVSCDQVKLELRMEWNKEQNDLG